MSTTVISGVRYFLAAMLVTQCLLFSSSDTSAQSLAEVEVTPLTVTTANGRFIYQAELAITPQQRSQGLMFRREMAQDHGMLFDFLGTMVARMWMKNTYLPLDMVFLKRDGTIANIVANTTPHSLDIISSRVPVRYVLELNAGEAARASMKTGDRFQHPLFAKTAD